MAVGPVPTPDWLLDALPFRPRPNLLPLEPLDCPLILSRSLAVAPLSPDVGDGWILRDEDLEGTGSRFWPFSFLEEEAFSGANRSFSFELSATAWGFSSISRDMISKARLGYVVGRADLGITVSALVIENTKNKSEAFMATVRSIVSNASDLRLFNDVASVNYDQALMSRQSQLS